MGRIRLSITVREELLQMLEEDRGLVSMSRYVDTLLGITYGLDSPEVLDNLPVFMRECLEALEELKRTSSNRG